MVCCLHLTPVALALLCRVILDEAAETGLEADDEDDTGDVALLSPSKMDTLGERLEKKRRGSPVGLSRLYWTHVSAVNTDLIGARSVSVGAELLHELLCAYEREKMARIRNTAVQTDRRVLELSACILA